MASSAEGLLPVARLLVAVGTLRKALPAQPPGVSGTPLDLLHHSDGLVKWAENHVLHREEPALMPGPSARLQYRTRVKPGVDHEAAHAALDSAEALHQIAARSHPTGLAHSEVPERIRKVRAALQVVEDPGLVRR